MNIAGFPLLEEALERTPSVAAQDMGVLSRTISIRNAIAITEMEGGQPSAICRRLLDLYETGEISGAEMRERMQRHARG